MISFSHTIFYVKDIPRAISFYMDAFGFAPKFVHESNQYAELNTGSTVIAFASELLAKSNLPKGYVPNDVNQVPLACEIVFTVPDVNKYYEKAIKSGAINVAPPQQKPWGQVVAYVRDPNGVLIEIASQMG